MYIYIRVRHLEFVDWRLYQHTSAYVSIRQHTLVYVNIRKHTAAYVSMRQHMSAYVSEFVDWQLYLYVSSYALSLHTHLRHTHMCPHTHPSCYTCVLIHITADYGCGAPSYSSRIPWIYICIRQLPGRPTSFVKQLIYVNVSAYTPPPVRIHLASAYSSRIRLFSFIFFNLPPFVFPLLSQATARASLI